MEPLSSIVSAIGDLLVLATAAINLVIAIRPRTRHGSDRNQHPEDGPQAGR